MIMGQKRQSESWIHTATHISAWPVFSAAVWHSAVSTAVIFISDFSDDVALCLDYR